MLDQPANEMLYLEAILNAFAESEKLGQDVGDKKEAAKTRLKERGD